MRLPNPSKRGTETLDQKRNFKIKMCFRGFSSSILFEVFWIYSHKFHNFFHFFTFGGVFLCLFWKIKSNIFDTILIMFLIVFQYCMNYYSQWAHQTLYIYRMVIIREQWGWYPTFLIWQIQRCFRTDSQKRLLGACAGSKSAEVCFRSDTTEGYSRKAREIRKFRWKNFKNSSKNFDPKVFESPETI